MSQLRNPKFYLMVLADAVCFVVALYGAYALRFEFSISAYTTQIEGISFWYVPVKLACFYFLGLYRGMWRFTSTDDLWRMAQATAVALLTATFLILYIHRFQGFSRSVFLVDAILSFFLAGGLRISIRSFYAARESKQGFMAFSLPLKMRNCKMDRRVLIIGAGGAGEKMLREIFDNPNLSYHVVGFLDDDPGKDRRMIRGVPVLGSVADLPEVVEQFKVGEVFISTPSATGAEMRRIIEICKSTSVPFKTLPALGAIMDGKVSVKVLRDVNYQDLLRRPPVKLDTAGIESCLGGKTVLVTGAGGSIGSELCRQLIRFKPDRLVLVDAGESNLYEIQMELHHELGFRDYQCVLARVQDQPLMREVFSSYRPHVVFHAAAYKHVPMLERNPWEAVFNNILGSWVTMELAEDHGAERFVLVSTDKAVRPTNVMGASKRVTELISQSFHGSSTRFMSVRFGNVIGSSGSVIPLFRKQIEQGGPVTVTDPEVTRYFMTIPEAAQLILQAGSLGEGGEIFVLEMGTPVRIAEMAEDLIRLSGKRPGVDIEIVYTGLREGEKLYEELITHDEGVTRTAHEKIMVLRPNGGNGSGKEEFFSARLQTQLDSLYEVANSHQAAAIRCKLNEIVPEYAPRDSACVLPEPTPPHAVTTGGV